MAEFDEGGKSSQKMGDIDRRALLAGIFGVGATLLAPKFANAQDMEKQRAELLKSLGGTWKGFTPTDESAIAMGQFNMVVSEKGITFKFATQPGKVEEFSIAPGEIKSITNEDKILRFKIEGKLKRDIAVQFTVDEKTRERIPELCLVSGHLADIMGPTVAFSPEMVKRGKWDEAFKKASEGLSPESIQRIPVIKD